MPYWLTSLGFLMSLFALYIVLRTRWVEAMFLSVASVFVALWGLNDALRYGAPTFYVYVAIPAFILSGLTLLLAVLIGIAMKAVARFERLP